MLAPRVTPASNRRVGHAYNTSEHRPASSRVASQYRQKRVRNLGPYPVENGLSKRQRPQLQVCPRLHQLYTILLHHPGSIKFRHRNYSSASLRHDRPPMTRAQQELGAWHQEVSPQNPNTPLQQSPSNAAILCRVREGR
jgi:hypothetical protein